MFKFTEDPLIEVQWETDVLLLWLQPTAHSEARRKAVIERVNSVLTQSSDLKDAGVFLTGSYPTKTYLPDADVDIALHLPPVAADSSSSPSHSWVCAVNSALCQAAIEQTEADTSVDASLHIRNVTFVNGRVKVVTCLVGNLAVDVSAARKPALAAALLVEESDRALWSYGQRSFSNTDTLVLPLAADSALSCASQSPQQHQQQHLLKRSLVLVKAWCLYESGALVAALAPWLDSVPVLCSRGGRLSTYAVSAMVLSLFNDCKPTSNPAAVAVNPKGSSNTSSSREKTEGSSSASSRKGSNSRERVEKRSSNNSSEQSKEGRERSNSEGEQSSGGRQRRNDRKDQRSRSGSWDSEDSALEKEVSEAVSNLCWAELNHPLLVLLRFLTVFSSFDWERFALTLDHGAVNRQQPPPPQQPPAATTANNQTSSSASRKGRERSGSWSQRLAAQKPAVSPVPAVPPPPSAVPLRCSGRASTSTFFTPPPTPSSSTAPTALPTTSSMGGSSRPFDQVLTNVRGMMVHDEKLHQETQEKAQKKSSQPQQSPSASHHHHHHQFASFAASPMVILDPLDPTNNLATGVGVHGARAINVALDLGKQRLEAFLCAQLCRHRGAAAAEASAAAAAVTTTASAGGAPERSSKKAGRSEESPSVPNGSDSSSSSSLLSSVASTRKLGRPPRHPIVPNPSTHSPVSHDVAGAGRTMEGADKNEDPLASSLDFLRHMFPVTLAAFGQVPGVHTSNSSSSSYSALKRSVVVVDPPPAVRRRHCSGESQHSQHRRSSSSSSSSPSLSSPSPLPSLMPSLAVPLNTLSRAAAFEVANRTNPDLHPTSFSSLAKPNTLSPLPPAIETPPSPRAELGRRLHDSIVALLESKLTTTMATGAARSKAPETVPLTQSSTLLKLLAVLDSGNFAHFFLADESGEENRGAWSSGGARVARPSDIAGKVTGMLIEAMTTDDLRGLVASAAAGDALGSNPTRSIAGVTDNSFDLEELVCQALETILKHAAEQEQKQHYQNEKKQHATGPGTSREQTLKNSSTASLKPLKPPRPSESAPEIAVVLMVEGNGFRSDLLDHPMQQSVAISRRFNGANNVQSLQSLQSLQSRESGDKSQRSRRVLAAAKDGSMVEEEEEADVLFAAGVGEFGYDVAGACLEGDSAKMVHSLRTVTLPPPPSVPPAVLGRTPLPTASLPVSPPHAKIIALKSSAPTSQSASSLVETLQRNGLSSCAPLGINGTNDTATITTDSEVPTNVVEHLLAKGADMTSVQGTQEEVVIDLVAGQRQQENVSATGEISSTLGLPKSSPTSVVDGSELSPTQVSAQEGGSGACAAVSVGKGLTSGSAVGGGGGGGGAGGAGKHQKRKGKNKTNAATSTAAAAASTDASVMTTTSSLPSTTPAPEKASCRGSENWASSVSSGLRSFFFLLHPAVGLVLVFGGFVVVVFIVAAWACPSVTLFIEGNGSDGRSLLAPHQQALFCRSLSSALPLEWTKRKLQLAPGYCDGNGSGEAPCIESQQEGVGLSASSDLSEVNLSAPPPARAFFSVFPPSVPPPTVHSSGVSSSNAALRTAAAGPFSSSSQKSVHSTAAAAAGGDRRSTQFPPTSEKERGAEATASASKTATTKDVDSKDLSSSSWSLRRSTSLVFSTPSSAPTSPQSSQSRLPLAVLKTTFPQPQPAQQPPLSESSLLPNNPLPTADFEQQPQQQQQQQQQHWMMAGENIVLGDLDGFGLKEEAAQNNNPQPPSLSRWRFLWQKDGDVLFGETRSFIRVSKAVAEDAGSYSCFVRRVSPAEMEAGTFGAFGVVPVYSSVLRIAFPPSAPKGLLVRRDVTVGSTLVLEVPFPGVSGHPLPLCQWSFQGFPLKEHSVFKGGHVATADTGAARAAGAAAMAGSGVDSGAGSAGSGGGGSGAGTGSGGVDNGGVGTGGGGAKEDGEEEAEQGWRGSCFSPIDKQPHRCGEASPARGRNRRTSSTGMAKKKKQQQQNSHGTRGSNSVKHDHDDGSYDGGNDGSGGGGSGAYGARLRVGNMSSSLAGTYTCDCTNEVGTVRWTEALVDVVEVEAAEKEEDAVVEEEEEAAAERPSKSVLPPLKRGKNLEGAARESSNAAKINSVVEAATKSAGPFVETPSAARGHHQGRGHRSETPSKGDEKQPTKKPATGGHRHRFKADGGPPTSKEPATVKKEQEQQPKKQRVKKKKKHREIQIPLE